MTWNELTIRKRHAAPLLPEDVCFKNICLNCVLWLAAMFLPGTRLGVAMVTQNCSHLSTPSWRDGAGCATRKVLGGCSESSLSALHGPAPNFIPWFSLQVMTNKICSIIRGECLVGILAQTSSIYSELLLTNPHITPMLSTFAVTPGPAAVKAQYPYQQWVTGCRRNQTMKSWSAGMCSQGKQVRPHLLS